MAKKPSKTENAAGADPVGRLFDRVESAKGGDPAISYTARLIERGVDKIAQKLGEEAVEAVIEIVRGDRAAIVRESADLLYHLAVAWATAGVRPEEVWAELARREALSGLAEKASRKA